MARCTALTRKGTRCSVDAKSKFCDANGNLVARPLLNGASQCLFHIRPFVTRRVLRDPPYVVLALDLETTGVDPLRDRVLELAACRVGVGMHGVSFSSTVYVDVEIRKERGVEAAAVHGIGDDDIDISPTFSCVWRRFEQFVSNLLVVEPASDSDTEAEDYEPGPTRLLEERPKLVLIAHNGIRFDFCMLLSECMRHNVGTALLEQCLFVDSCSIVRCAAPPDLQGCSKLQCIANRCCDVHAFRAHRALDDCVALASVLEYIAAWFGVRLSDLVRHFLEQLDLSACYIEG